MNPPDRHHSTTELLHATLDAHPADHITLKALMLPLQRRAYGFLLLLLAIPTFLPVPFGIGALMGGLVMTLGLQMLIGLEHPWLPAFLTRRPISRAALRQFLARIAPITLRLERLCRPRLQRIAKRPLTAISGLVMTLLGLLLMLPIPFTNYLFGALLLVFAFALIERDGLLLLLVWLATLTCLIVSATLSSALAELFLHLF
ncbi:MAG: exopolysaccharide biosynthesis protein [Rhodanobacter sp.]|jgi:hypothetical protein|nr:exopolysaccharide biosynthesis protein [Rhodanobacter sp.]